MPPSPAHQLSKGRPCYPALHTRKLQGALATQPCTPGSYRAPLPPTPTHEEGKGTLTTHPCTPGRYKCHPHLHTRMVQGQGALVPHSFTPGWYRAPLPPTSAHQKGTAFVNFVLLSMCYVSGHHRAPPDGDALGDRLYIYGLCSCHRPLHAMKVQGGLSAHP